MPAVPAVQLQHAPDHQTELILLSDAGGPAVGPHASDLLAPVALAIQLGATLDDMAPVFGAHPSLTELPFMAARA